MNYLSRILNAIDYIEANLDFDITSERIAQEANISHWHFQRIFKALTNETLKTYIRSRRLANAFDKLLSTDQRIIEIAILAGFESQESFSRAFKKAFEMTPHAARKGAHKNMFMKKVEFNSDYLRHINQNVSLEPEIIIQNRRLFVGIKTRCFSVESDKNNIADKLPKLWSDFLPRVNEISSGVSGTAYGIIRQGTDKTGGLEYFAVREVSEFGVLPSEMVSLELPESTYAKFTHTGNVTDLDNTVNYIYSSWLLRSGMRHSYGPDIEIYGAEYVANSDKSILHYAIPLVT